MALEEVLRKFNIVLTTPILLKNSFCKNFTFTYKFFPYYSKMLLTILTSCLGFLYKLFAQQKMLASCR